MLNKMCYSLHDTDIHVFQQEAPVLDLAVGTNLLAGARKCIRDNYDDAKACCDARSNAGPVESVRDTSSLNGRTYYCADVGTGDWDD